MALIGDDSRCTLCGDFLGDACNWLATTAVGLRPPLSRMDDSAAHHECLKNWEYKQEFVDAYNSRWRKPKLMITDDGHVRYVRPERHIIAWYVWLAMPVLLPLCFGYHTVAWLRDRFITRTRDL